MKFCLLIFLVLMPSLAFCDTDGRLIRCEPYRASVVKILRENGVDEQFYFLMVAESGCRSASVTSGKGAVGFWQMMPATARAHGCDNLEELECATKAAASYLKDLSTRFDGDDIIAAWNQGGHNLQRNGRSAEAQGLINRFHSLKKEGGKNE